MKEKDNIIIFAMKIFRSYCSLGCKQKYNDTVIVVHVPPRVARQGVAEEALTSINTVLVLILRVWYLYHHGWHGRAQ